jgi:hypothetical protein
MKEKIVGILICTLLIAATVLPVAGIELQKPGNSTLQPPIEWEKTYGSAMVDWGRCVQQTSDGGYIISGAYDRNVYMPWQGFVYLLKTDAMGNVEWDKQYGIYPYENLGQYIQQTSDGGYIIAGYIGYTYHIDAYVLKTDSGGNLTWTRILGKFDYYDNSLSVQQTTDGGYIITGWTGSYGAGSSDAWLIKINSDGEDEWNKTFGGSGLDGGDCVKQTFDGGFIITGRTDSFDSGGNGDAWLIKTDMNGNEIWNKSYGGHYLDDGKSVLQTSDGGYILTGSTSSFGAGNHDAWLIKTDSNGNEIWNNTYGGSSWDQGKSVVQTADGGYFITGDYTDPVQGDLELYMVKTDSEGIEEWNYIIEHNSKGNTDSGSYGIQTNDGGYIVTGETGEYNLAKIDLLLIKLEGENQAPNSPDINGPANGNAGTSYEYGFISTDPEADAIMYKIDWGDDETEWTEYGDSGVEFTLKHTWTSQGTFTIKAQAIDFYGAESDWAEFTVTMPKDKAIDRPLLKFLQCHPNLFPIIQKLL